MPEHPGNDEELERERRESTDLGYRDTEEERAYEQAEPEHDTAERPAEDDDPSGGEAS